MSSTPKGELVLPALRAHMGDWVYYISFMKMKDLAERITRIPQMYSSATLQELLQRQIVAVHRNDIERYLISQPQRLFNALVIGTSGGDPKWHEVEIEERPSMSKTSLPKYFLGSLGLLVLDGSERLFTIDGQHRVEGISLAVKKQPKLNEEEVCVVLVKAVTATQRKDDQKGFQRTRRLFSVLNRYAKPVSLMDTIALDEDDPSAIITRRLVEEYDLFTGKKISIRQVNSIPSSDPVAVTSIISLYNSIDFYLGGFGKSRSAWVKEKQYRPAEDVVDESYKQTVTLWNTYCKHFPPFQEAKESDEDDNVPGKYRSNQGGHLLFRPIGLLLSAKTIRRLKDLENASLEKAVSGVAEVPMDLAKEPWVNLIWDQANSRMLAAAENQRVAERVFYYGAGGDLDRFERKKPTRGSKLEDLKYELAGILKTEPKDVKLARYVD